ncbi:unnamed protein product [Ectocarpus fasciculatus]
MPPPPPDWKQVHFASKYGDVFDVAFGTKAESASSPPAPQ